jgi:uncharacterized protein (TIGR01777 family)
MSKSNKQTILIAGGDGLVGKHLVNIIDTSQYHVIILSRKKKTSYQAGVEYAVWDTDKKTIDDIPSPDHIINLAGAGIADQRWTEQRKTELIASRVNSAETIKNYLKLHKIHPMTYVSASAVGYYGDRGTEILTENSLPGNEFLSECCVAWEKAVWDAGALCSRTIILRIGIVMSSLGGALPKMLMTKKLGIFNYFGKGDQYYPWIHITDLSRLCLESIENQQFNGIYNAVAPQQLTNKEMMKDIMQTGGMKGLLIPAPEFSLRWMLGEMANVVLNSDRIMSDRLLNSGFNFEHNKVGEAVVHVLQKNI